MTNLTEKWKKGELPDGKYWVMLDVYGDGEPELSDVQISDGSPIGWCDESIKEVLAEVPSYEQWQKHRKTLLKTQEMNCDLEIKNTKLKAVLKRCREFVDDFPTDNDECWAYRNAVLNGIDELLGEE